MHYNKLLFVHVSIILMALCAEACQTVCNIKYYKGDNLVCHTFNIKDYCFVKESVKAERGTVGDSIIAKEIFITKDIRVGDYLTCGELACTYFESGDACKVNEVQAQQGIIGGSMTITGKGFIGEKLLVKGLLFCCYLKSPRLTTVGSITAAHSDFGDIYVEGLSKNNAISEMCEFMNCKINSILLPVSSIIVLRDKTMVTGNIVFKKAANNIVWLSRDSYIKGKVFNGASVIF